MIMMMMKMMMMIVIVMILGLVARIPSYVDRSN